MTPKGFHWRETFAARVLVPDFVHTLGLAGGYSIRAFAGRDLDCCLRGGKDAALVVENRIAVTSTMGIPFESLVLAEQVHGREVAVVTLAERGRGARSHAEAVADADALVTGEPGLALAALSADCAVILVADENRRAVAAIHSGRRGAALNVAAAAVARLAGLRAAPDSLYAAIGPAICPSCYKVGPEVSRDFEEAFPWAREFLKISPGRVCLDLPGIVRRQLVEAGLRPERVFDSGLCPVCRNDLFFSYRKEGDSAGRCMGAISLAPKAARGNPEVRR